MITGKTRVVGLLGWPVEHSMSPVIQNAAFQAAGLDYIYVAFPVKPQALAQAMTGLRALGIAGVNVTVPHKVSIIPYLDGLDRSAEFVGAVNTVVFAEDGTIGYNTDMDGFVNSLFAERVAIDGKRAVLLGAGGAARAVVCGLLANGIRSVTVGARDAAKARLFATSFSRGDVVKGYEWRGPLFDEALRQTDLLINCTPLGMVPRTGEEPPMNWADLNRQAAVCDLIYNPVETRFLARAAAAGHKTISGGGMLVEQAALAFSLWTGTQAPRIVMVQEFAGVLAVKQGKS